MDRPKSGPGGAAEVRVDVETVADAVDEFYDAPPGTQLDYDAIIGRFGVEGGLVFYEGLAARFGADQEDWMLPVVGWALLSKGAALATLGRYEAAVAAYD